MMPLNEPFSVCFNIMKIKYKDYDESITQKNFLQPDDSVNVFINLESILKNISMINELENKIILQREFQTIFIANTLNLIGHYKRFFVNNGLRTKVYLYYTSLKSTEFLQYRYNDDYRSYYLMKYNDNPKFALLHDCLEEMLPEIQTYCTFLPNVYCIEANNIEGSLVPYIISKESNGWKNFIISGDSYDSQYGLLPGFVSHIFQRGYGMHFIGSRPEDYIKILTRKKEETIDSSSLSFFSSYPMYCLLLSVYGNKSRSIDDLSGIKYTTLVKMLKEGIENSIIQKETQNPNRLKEIFNTTDQNEFLNNFYCTAVTAMYEELRDIDKKTIFYQCNDRIDLDSLKKLNVTKFANHPIILESLL